MHDSVGGTGDRGDETPDLFYSVKTEPGEEETAYKSLNW